jgi:serine/threonine protein kinase
VSYDRFGPYVIHECLGTGGMATVHRATLELEDGGTCDVALKRLLPQLADDRKLVDDFIREAKLASQLVHPNIARILEAGRINKTYFIAMELVRGASLVSLLRRVHVQQRTTPIGVVLALAIELCDALDYAHEGTNDAGEPIKVVHRDLSPSNLLISDDGHLKVIDFGVAKALAGQHQTSSGMAKGKLGYMSVEAIGGKQLDERADIFSAGVVLWELLAGKRLFKGKNEYEVITRIQRGDVEPPSRHCAECPTELDAIVLRALARQADARWASAAALRRELVRLRRFYVADTNPEAVVRWARQLHVDTDSEATEVRLTREDLEEADLAEGSRRAEPFAPAAPIVAPQAAPTRPRFVESDTMITDAERPETDRED